MDDTIEIHLTLTRDTPSSMTFKDTYQDLNRIWSNSKPMVRGT
jgi:hypothetical protein